VDLCATVDSATRNARAISSVVKPPSSRSVSHACLGGQHRVAGGEDQAEQVVAEMVVECGVQVRLVGLAREAGVAGKRLQLLRVAGLAAQGIDRTLLGGGHEPGPRVVRHARRWPLLERDHERVLQLQEAGGPLDGLLLCPHLGQGVADHLLGLGERPVGDAQPPAGELGPRGVCARGQPGSVE
jgi:hypothetical protein